MTPAAEQRDVPMLRMSGITKRFVGIQVLTNVTFEARAGEVARDSRGKRCRQVHADEDPVRRL